MAIQGNASDQEVVKSKSLYTGMMLSKVVAVNPSNAEFAELYGITPESGKAEPEYLKQDKNGTPMARLSFYLAPAKDQYALRDGTPEKNPVDVITPVTFFIRNAPLQGGEGRRKFQFIDINGSSGWAESVSQLRYVDKGTARKAYAGEVPLIDFIRNWANVASGQPCHLDDITKLFSGDFSEIRNIFQAYKENAFYALLGVRTVDGKTYQDVYSDMFLRSYARSYELMVRNLSRPRSCFGDPKNPTDYQNSMILQLYNPTTVTGGGVKTSSYDEAMDNPNSGFAAGTAPNAGPSGPPEVSDWNDVPGANNAPF